MSALAAIYCLSQDNIPGASLSGKSLDDLNVKQLKQWLACHGARRSGKKAELHTVSIQCILSLSHDCICREASKIITNYFDYCRVKEYIHVGLDTNIIDPDKGANIARKLERLRASGLNEKDHPNLRLSPAIPTEGWTSNLADLPPVSFATLYTHFIERPTRAILDDSNMSAMCESEDDERLPSFRGLRKGYRFF